MSDVLIADCSHYQGSPDFATYAKHAPAVALKATEGIGYDTSWYRTQFSRAKAAGLVVGAYHYLLRGDGAAQAREFLTPASSADFFTVDVEGPDPSHVAGSLASASAGEIVATVKAFSEAFHMAMPGRPLLMYGRSLMRDRGITDRMGCDLLWAPRYNGTTVVRANLGSCLDYGWPDELVAMWQFTGDGLGPLPHTMPGFPANTDVNLLFLPLEQLTGTGTEDDVRFDNWQQGFRRRLNQAGPPDDKADGDTKQGFSDADVIMDAVAAAAKTPVGGGGGGVSPQELAKHAADGEAHQHGHKTGLPQKAGG